MSTHELQQVVDFTKTIFPGFRSTGVVHDPEIVDYSKVAVQVVDHGPVADVIGRDEAWNAGMVSLLGERSGEYVLSIDTGTESR